MVAAVVLKPGVCDAQELYISWALKHGCAAVGREAAEVTVVVPPMTSEIIDVIASRISERVSPMSLSGSSSPVPPGFRRGGESYVGDELSVGEPLSGFGSGSGAGSGAGSGSTLGSVGTKSTSGSTKPAFVSTIRVNDSISPSMIRILTNIAEPFAETKL